MLRSARMGREFGGVLAEQTSPRLVIVSNRVPARKGPPGGLAVALNDATQNHDCLWFGWSGEIAAAPAGEPRLERRDGVTFAVTDLTPAEHEGYYLGFSNRLLWPTFHYRLDLSAFREEDYQAYRAVNERFAAQLSRLLRPDDLVWIHDYHLIPLAHALRRRRFDNPIGFFNHIPFPPPEIFRAAPRHGDLAGALMAYDLAGFQSERDRVNFERVMMEMFHGLWLPDGRIQAFDRVARARAFPIGLDPQFFARAGRPAAPPGQTLLGAGRRRIIGVDRMDYSKGLKERFHAVRDLFERRPDLRAKVSLLQIAPVSRGDVEAYARLRHELDELVGGINGDFAQLDWEPIRYLAQGFPRETLAALYRDADIGLVTPLRDGMNLVAKEYVAAQNPEDPGVLVLSEFAGAAEQLKSALIVNPHDTRQVSEAIERALAMPLKERRSRHGEMLDTIQTRDARWWTETYIEALKQSGATSGADRLRTRLNRSGSPPDTSSKTCSYVSAS